MITRAGFSKTLAAASTLPDFIYDNPPFIDESVIAVLVGGVLTVTAVAVYLILRNRRTRRSVHGNGG